MVETPAKKSDLGTRTASAIVMITVAGGALWLGGWLWSAFAVAVAIVVFAEWLGLVGKFASGTSQHVIWTLLGVVYVGFAGIFLAALGNDQIMGGGGFWLVVTLLSVVIGTDTGAYFTGRTLGGPKIAPAISPSKTWSGLLGGMILAAVAMAGSAKLGIVNISVAAALAIGAALAVVAQAGDFLESWMKRRAGVKDSGKLIPGHGGVFDRVDGLLAVTFSVGVGLLCSLANATDL
jgi:phosphatidate cytidylyltransferase